MKRIFFLLLLLMTCSWIVAQVTIGDGTPPQKYSILEISTAKSSGGLRLPQLNTAQRDSLDLKDITDAEKEKAIGLAIANTDNGCYEYWSGKEWISLCDGQINMRFKDDQGDIIEISSLQFDPKGEEKGPYTPIEEKPCIGVSESYTFTLISGMQYVSINVIDATIGTFKVSMPENPTAVMRSAIMRITNNCTGKNKDILLIQNGNTNLCNGAITPPEISMSGDNTICIGGAVYMSITNPVDSVSYIWTLNGVELGRGNYYVANQPGKYIVYVNAIGCSNHSEEVLVQSETEVAPTPEKITLYATNNGVICSNKSITLTAFNVPKTGNLTWYKNGVLQTSKGVNQTTIPIGVNDEGTWFAVMENSGCFSPPSKSIQISSNIGTDPLVQPVIYVNGVDINTTSEFCKAGRLNLELHNKTAYSIGISVAWYNGLTYLGEGTELSITSPSQEQLILRCIVTDNTNTYCSAEAIVSKPLTGTAPPIPSISGNPMICGGTPASLQVSGTGSSYIWYRNGEEISGETSSSLTASEIGSYRVEIKDAGGCISPKSQPVIVGLSDFPGLSWTAVYDNVELGETKTFQVLGSFNPKSYEWAVDSGATIINGQGQATVSIKFPNNAIHVNVSVKAINQCGESDVLKKTVNVSEKCTDAVVRGTSMSPQGNIASGTAVSMSATATGSPELYYKWYCNNVQIKETSSPTFSISSTKPSDSGVYSVSVYSTCDGTNKESNKMLLGTINVIDVEGGISGSGKGSLKGETCFDIAVSNDDTSCGLLALRQQYKADFTKTYEYVFTSIGSGNTNLEFIVEDNEKAIESITIDNLPGTLTDGGKYKLKIKYKESLSTSLVGRTTDQALKVNIYAMFKNGSTTYKEQLTVNIKDCDCCTMVSDIEGNTYTSHRFGDAGCWMTENLASTRNSLGTFQEKFDKTEQVGTTNANYLILDPANPKLTTVYNFGVMRLGGGKPGDQGSGFGSKSQVQGPCPDGWVVPSDYEFFELMRTIGANPLEYSTYPTSMTIPDNEYDKNSSNTIFGTYTAIPMKSSKSLYGQYPTNGRSFTDGSGFNAQLVGIQYLDGTVKGWTWGSKDQKTRFWTSDIGTQQFWGRGGTNYSFSYSTNYITRDIVKENMHSAIRCKKKE